jgi:chromosome segregation ATPase
MIEPVMYIGIGFLIAGLLVIGVIPLVHARAVRLTMRRLEALTPISRAEIQADKDQLRAEFAMAMSRLEMNVEQMKAKATSQAAEIGRKSDAIGRLKFELGEKTAALLALEAKEGQLADEVRALENELAARTGVLQETEGALASTRAEFARIAANFKQSSLSSDTQRAELAAVQAQAALLHDHVGGYDKENKELRERLSNKTAEVEAVRQQLTTERGRAEQLGARAAQADALGRQVQEFGTQLEEQARFLTDYENAADRLRNEAMSARESESALRAELTETEGRYRVAIDTVTTEKSLIESELKRSQDERAKLQRDIAAMRRDAESGGANVRKENAVLRESINDVAAEVARLTATLEGPDSPIAAILDGDAARPAASAANGASTAKAPRTGEAKDTLADRIRTLQGGAPRAAGASEPARGPARNAQQRR